VSAGVVVYRRTGAGGEIDAIDQYSKRLVSSLNDRGVDVRYLPDGLAPAVTATETPAWVLLQYNPFSYGRWGFAPGLLRDVLALRRRAGVPIAIMVHEAWVPMTDWRTAAMGLWQRAQLRALLRLVDRVMTSTEVLARELGEGAVHVPIATNITPVAISPDLARARLGLDGRLVVTLFGRCHPSRALDHAEAAIAALSEVHGPERMMVLNLGAGAPALRLAPEVTVRRPGPLAPDELSLHLAASDIVMLPFTDGVSTRRSTLMAALAHGRPVLGLSGENTDAVLAAATDALALTPAGDIPAFARAAVELTSDQGRLRAIGAAGLRLYETCFAWPVAAGRIATVFESISGRSNGRPSRRPAGAQDVVFVAHDISSSGGMERQSQQLVQRLLEAGHAVTVIARTCELSRRDGLRFIRVPTPRRPFSLAYPAFFAVASLFAARRRGALLHSTGAIITNRVDVCTVHYCHRAASVRVDGSRASRPGLLYRCNEAVSGILSRAAERWCYRPGRTRRLCAVSAGVTAEVKVGFPAMAPFVRTVPNGVDSTIFAPDPVARSRIRAELGIDDETKLALFVGGDWGRKGVGHAVDALAHTSGWHLAVAGVGDPEPLNGRARGAGTESRLSFLGPVDEMPRVYAAADAFVLPTSYETFSLVTYEAAASGLPLLVTHVSGVEDLLEDGVNGWFIARDGRDIARRLNALCVDPELAGRMAAEARTAAGRFTWDGMATGYMSVYAELGARRGRS
jgi:glycosyltransferase involved in cell wall biosynthesis